MSRLSWVQVVGQALTTNTKGGAGKNEHRKRNTHGVENANKVRIKEPENSLPKSRPWPTNQRISNESLDSGRSLHIESVVVWNDAVKTIDLFDIPPPTTTRKLKDGETIQPINNDGLTDINNQSLSHSVEPYNVFSSSASISVATNNHTNNRYKMTRPLLRQRNGSSSTIFQTSALAPVTIILTSPDDEDPASPTSPLVSIAVTKARKNSSTAQTTSNTSTDAVPFNQSALDPNLLMPPIHQHLVDIRRLEKVRRRNIREYRKVRDFTIAFMNDQGEHFPSKLRQKMMEAYGISEYDLSLSLQVRMRPGMEKDIRDEGVALERIDIRAEIEKGDKQPRNAEGLTILKTAFGEQREHVASRLEDSGIPLFIHRNNRHRGSVVQRQQIPLQTHVLGPESVKNSPPSRYPRAAASSTPRNIVTVSVFEAEIDVGGLRKKRAGGDMRQKRGDIKVIESEVDKKLRMVKHQTKMKRNNIIAGAFRSVKEALKGS